MKRVIAAILTIVMMFSLISCKKKEEVKETKKTYPAHTASYAKDVCSGCYNDNGFHAYEYLVEWVKENGTDTDKGPTYHLPVENSFIVYDLEMESLRVCYIMEEENGAKHTLIFALDDYSFMFARDEDIIIGLAEVGQYTDTNNPLHVLSSECTYVTSSDMAELARIEIVIIIESLKEFLEYNDWGITIADLGFTSYESAQP